LRETTCAYLSVHSINAGRGVFEFECRQKSASSQAELDRLVIRLDRLHWRDGKRTLILGNRLGSETGGRGARYPSPIAPAIAAKTNKCRDPA
jgi:hypothetical protein